MDEVESVSNGSAEAGCAGGVSGAAEAGDLLSGIVSGGEDFERRTLNAEF